MKLLLSIALFIFCANVIADAVPGTLTIKRTSDNGVFSYSLYEGGPDGELLRRVSLDDSVQPLDSVERVDNIPTNLYARSTGFGPNHFRVYDFCGQVQKNTVVQSIISTIYFQGEITLDGISAADPKEKALIYTSDNEPGMQPIFQCGVGNNTLLPVIQLYMDVVQTISIDTVARIAVYSGKAKVGSAMLETPVFIQYGLDNYGPVKANLMPGLINAWFRTSIDSLKHKMYMVVPKSLKEWDGWVLSSFDYQDQAPKLVNTTVKCNMLVPNSFDVYYKASKPWIVGLAFNVTTKAYGFYELNPATGECHHKWASEFTGSIITAAALDGSGHILYFGGVAGAYGSSWIAQWDVNQGVGSKPKLVTSPPLGAEDLFVVD